jgi:hypothetical protein
VLEDLKTVKAPADQPCVVSIHHYSGIGEAAIPGNPGNGFTWFSTGKPLIVSALAETPSIR